MNQYEQRQRATEPKPFARFSTRRCPERQSQLLDDALLETFPASDPVSVALIA